MTIEAQFKRIELSDGEAEYMGDGVWALLQRDEHGKCHSLIATEDDLKRLLAAWS